MDNFERAPRRFGKMALMDDLAWERCPDCLGHLDAAETEDGAAQHCRLCGYTGVTVPIPAPLRAGEDGIARIPGY